MLFLFLVSNFQVSGVVYAVTRVELATILYAEDVQDLLEQRHAGISDITLIGNFGLGLPSPDIMVSFAIDIRSQRSFFVFDRTCGS